MTAHSQTITKEVNEQRPYLGLASFAERHKSFFFGRDKEIKKLMRLVKNNVITVFFGNSGLGKTSLLRAGLFPVLRENYFLPVYIRILFTDDGQSSLELIKAEISNQITKIDSNIESISSLTLWEYFHTIEILNGLVTPVLIFDQFEEIFTLGKEYVPDVLELISELSDLIENQVPVVVQEKYKDAEIPFHFQDQKYRVVFSLREDYLPFLEKYNDMIPSIKKSRFQVTAMGKQEAFEAITKPGKQIINTNEADQILNQIIKTTYHSDIGKMLDFEFEPFLLSFICEQINEERINNHEEKISSKLIDRINIERLIRNHYQTNTSDDEKKIIEEHLLTLDGYRNIQVLNDINSKYNDEVITRIDIDQLINNRIIRKVTRNNVEYIELIHDVLVPILKTSRDQRRNEESEVEEKKLKAKIRNKERRKFLSILGLLLVLILIGGFWLYVQQTDDSKAQGLLASSMHLRLQQTQDHTLALRLAEEAYKINPININIANHFLSAYYSEHYGVGFSSTQTISSCIFSSNQKYLLIRYQDGTANLLKILENSIEEQPFDTSLVVINAQFSGNGEHLLVQSVRTIPSFDQSSSGYDITNNGGYDSNGNWDYDTISIWDIGSRAKNQLIIKSQDVIGDFSEHGDRVLFYKNDTAFINHVNEKKEILLHHDDPVSTAKFIPYQNKVLTVSRDQIYIWNSDGNLESAAKHESNYFNDIEFSRMHQLFVTIDIEGTSTLWNYSDRRLVSSPLYPEKLNHAKFAPDGISIVVVPKSRNTLTILKLKNFTELSELMNNDIAGETPYTTIDDLYMLFSEMDNPNFFTKSMPKKNASGPPSPTNSEENKIQESNKENNQIYNRVIRVIEGHQDQINHLNFSRANNCIITTSRDKTCRIWDFDGVSLHTLRSHESPVLAASFIDTSSRLITISEKEDNSIRSWKLDQFHNHLQQDSLIREKNIAAYKVGGSRIFVLDSLGKDTIQVYDTIQVLDDHQHVFVMSVFKSARNKYFLSEGIDRKWLWHKKNRIPLKAINNTKTIKSVDFDENENRAILLFSGNNIELYDIEKNESIHSFLISGKPIEQVWFSENEGHIVLSQNNGLQVEIPIEPEIVYDLLQKDSTIWKMDDVTKKRYGIVDSFFEM